MSAQLEKLAAALAPLVADQLVDELADRIIERLTEALDEKPTTTGLVDAAEIARRFGVSRDSVYRRAAEWGAVRLGDGPRARLRFDPDKVAAALAGETEPAPAPQAPRPRPRRRRPDSDLLPYRKRGPE